MVMSDDWPERHPQGLGPATTWIQVAGAALVLVGLVWAVLAFAAADDGGLDVSTSYRLLSMTMPLVLSGVGLLVVAAGRIVQLLGR